MQCIMNDLCKKGSYVAVYDDSEEVSKFKFGKLLCVNDSRFAMLLISPNGNYDGIVVDDTDGVFRIDTCGHYHKKMEKLDRSCIESVDLPQIDSSCIDVSLLSFAKERKKLVSIEIFDSGIVDAAGFIEAVSEEVCQIHKISEYGYDDGYTYIDMNSISQIVLDSEDEQRIERLYRLNSQSIKM